MLAACLLVPRLALACELAQHPGLAGQAVALADETGLRVAEARAMVPSLEHDQTFTPPTTIRPAAE